MKLSPEYNVVVLNGLWNRAVLQPEWVGNYIFPKEAVKAEYPIHPDMSPRYTSKGIRIYIQRDQLLISSTKEVAPNFELIQETVTKVFELLPHTPVRSLGINFLYVGVMTDSIRSLSNFGDSAVISKAELIPENWKVLREFKMQDCKLNLEIASISEEQFSASFNYHFVVDSFIRFKEIFSNCSIDGLKSQSDNLVKILFSNGK